MVASQKTQKNPINGESLKSRIHQEGYTLQEFCEKLKIGTSTFYYYRRGMRSVPHAIRINIEQILRCRFEEFLLVGKINTNTFIEEKDYRNQHEQQSSMYIDRSPQNER